jgi:hypothetical protein
MRFERQVKHDCSYTFENLGCYEIILEEDTLKII